MGGTLRLLKTGPPIDEIAFAFRITPAIVASSMGFALVMGVMRGLLPALRAARLPIAAAVRED